MASLVASENWACINGDKDSKGAEISQFNSNPILMSLLEESHVEEYNDEQLNRVIQSLESEINGSMLEEVHDLTMEPAEFFTNEEGGRLCLASMEYQWPNNMELMPCSPSDDMNWYVENYAQVLGDIVEFGGFSDYTTTSNIVSFEEHSFSSLWLETYDTVTDI